MPMIGSTIRLMRPWEWVKNVFVLPAPIFAIATVLEEPGHDLGSIVAATAGAFFAFCLVASGFYCINDAADAAEDRRHPAKRHRPIASGRVGKQTGYFMGGGLVTASLVVAGLVNHALLATLSLYALLQILYNLRLKRIVFVDVATVASGFALRAAAGAVAIEIQISIWMLLSIFFLCLFMGFTKRLSDMVTASRTETGWESPAGYVSRVELEWLLGVSSVLATMTYLVYSLSPHAHNIFGDRTMGFALLTPLVLIALHGLYRRARAGLSDSLLRALGEDRSVRNAIVLFALGTLAVLYLPYLERALSAVFFLSGTDAGP